MRSGIMTMTEARIAVGLDKAPAPDKNTSLSIYVPEEVARKLTHLAQAKNLNRSKVAARLLEWALLEAERRGVFKMPTESSR